MARKWFFDPLIPHAYDVINIDPPTHFKTFSAFESAKGAQYPTMDDSWVRALPVIDLASSGGLLWMWTTMPKLTVSIDILRAWGFRFVTAGCWHKKTPGGATAKGTGFVLQSSAEVYLIGAAGHPKYRARPQPGLIDTSDTDALFYEALAGAAPEVIEAERREHSRKPDQQYDILDALMGTDVRRCELFARQARPGWEAWGNQVDHFEPLENS